MLLPHLWRRVTWVTQTFLDVSVPPEKNTSPEGRGSVSLPSFISARIDVFFIERFHNNQLLLPEPHMFFTNSRV